MDQKIIPPVRSFIPAALLLVAMGASGFYGVVQFTEPSGGTRWLFYFFAILGLSGLALPAVAYLNHRFPSTPPPVAWVIVRQALWVGVYIPLLAWLQDGEVLTPALALLLSLGLIVIESLLRMRERSQWKPEG